MHIRPSTRITLCIAPVVFLLAPSCRRETNVDGRASLARAVATRGNRTVRGRLSPPFGYVPLGRVSRGREEGDAAFRALSAEYAGSADPRVAGIAALLRGDSARAVDQLRRATTRGAAGAWADLAAALLAESERSGKTEPLLDGLAAAGQARRIAPGDSAAAFNQALALEQLGLRAEAHDAWLQYARLDSSSGWASEAAAAARRIETDSRRADWQRDRVQLEAAADRGDSGAVNTLVRANPRDARVWGEGVYPSAWAEAMQKGDVGGAGLQLGRARSIGDALSLEWHEQLLHDAVASIDRATPSTRAALARAYLAYRAARIEHSKHDAGAVDHLRRAASLFHDADHPMQYVATYYQGSALFGEQRLRECVAVLDALAALHLEEKGYRALAAQIGWERGLANLSLGNFTAALEIFERSRRVFDELDDAADSATIQSFIATAYDSAGDFERAWTARRAALQALSSEADAPRRMLVLIAASSSFIRREQWDRAVPVLDIVVDRTRRMKDALRLCSALSYRATALASLGFDAAARADLTELHQRVPEISDEQVRTALLLDAHYAEALLLEGRDDGRAIAELTAALQDVGRAERALFASRLYLKRAKIYHRIGRPDDARRDVLAGLDQNEKSRVTIADEALRAMATLSSETLFQEGIALALERRDVTEAFELSERMRARALLELFEARVGGTASAPLSLPAIQRALAPDAAILEYAVLPDRIVQFVVTPREARAFQRVVSVETLRDLAASAASAIRAGHDRAPLTAAAEVFLAPSADALAGVAHLAIVPDRAITAVPFVALPFPGSAEFVVDRMSIAIAPSASLAIECSRRARNAMRETAIAIGASQFDRSHFTDLPLLPAVSAEARIVASVYRRGEVLIGDDATPRNIVKALPGANVIHFAGHSVAPPFDGLAATLVVASDGVSERLTARDIARLRLANASLVMLSSCRSAQAGTTGDGVENLATAFLVAGAPSVLGASWDIDDEAAHDIALSIHQQYRVDGDSARAFQDTARNPTIRSQNAWRVVTPFGGSPSLVKKGERER
jgi:CHAT domain-containing protein